MNRVQRACGGTGRWQRHFRQHEPCAESVWRNRALAETLQTAGTVCRERVEEQGAGRDTSDSMNRVQRACGGTGRWQRHFRQQEPCAESVWRNRALAETLQTAGTVCRERVEEQGAGRDTSDSMNRVQRACGGNRALAETLQTAGTVCRERVEEQGAGRDTSDSMNRVQRACGGTGRWQRHFRQHEPCAESVWRNRALAETLQTA
ncbi:hypothetical protein CesoFtcFv8_012061 [Champsocephalus esox]|uniref:Uncharacterized protein n=1 Tax=Champsocephalus esox TaxID=159716 RepID=A0AAN8C0V0_9TELE|nr:hypothetical protein CesoFtcFv8_012061 [Champsocephalus esox]